uniref:Uncharacterized protein n=1 Tax=Cacopsylla melanoneura TaxID=428564 RepID=A0A8D8MBN4_9HEMI
MHQLIDMKEVMVEILEIHHYLKDMRQDINYLNIILAQTQAMLITHPVKMGSPLHNIVLKVPLVFRHKDNTSAMPKVVLETVEAMIISDSKISSVKPICRSMPKCSFLNQFQMEQTKLL